MHEETVLHPSRTGSRSRSKRALALLVCGSMVLGVAPAQTPAAAPAQRAAPAIASALNEQPLTLREAAQMAVLKNPEVLARWHTVKSAEGERDAAKGGLYPRVDLSASTGPERRSEVDGRYSRSWATLSLTQLLYDGLATIREVRRLDHATRVRVFELIGTSEGIALEAARAYFDVLRYRELVQLAEENFIEHRTVYTQTDDRVKARVARAVDLEQITGRLALAEANLLIETSNLHDTTARFQRIVGRLPSREMPVPAYLAQGLPTDPATALAKTHELNPFVLAAIENVRAGQAALETRDSAYQPRFDFRVKRDQGRNLEGVAGNSNATVAEIVMNWNLFNGFADRARERQFAEQLNIAKDVRDKTCRDTRQTTTIAYNDIVKLHEQLEYLKAHEGALSKALTAYRLQFQIGQRSLLDLLDTENERFQSRRAVVNAQQDLNIAYVRTQAGIGTLLPALQLARLDTAMDEEIRAWTAGADAAQQCPAEPVTVYAVDKNALVARALQQAARMPMPLGPATGPAGPGAATAAPSAPAAVTAQAAPVPAPVAPAATDQAVRNALEAWRAAWASQDIATYLQSYAPDFVPPRGTRDAWEKQRRDIIGRASGVSIALEGVTIAPDKDRTTTSFVQVYRSASYQDKVRKTLVWRLIDGRWKIVRETSEAAAELPPK
ncbi:TolC family outer membrane protein [Caenimonas sedimenti]|uniref:TolC family outer membrane protein n=1 Tax=Caenimonas sedimenti TaxID=2596921 RepID=A0A562ZF00_9BURK|nr:TolC family outer membrane protein [Caenimonas sedimenti]TWO66121.1 TolC family outer membrane protein [Caenimonas sedimenti]